MKRGCGRRRPRYIRGVKTTLEELDPTESDKYALAAELRYVGVRLRNMRNAVNSTTLWAQRADKTMLKAEDMLLDRARILDGRDVEA